MKRAKKIVLTGGPAGGKTLALQAIARYFPGSVWVLNEVATLLFNSGAFPKPGEHLPYSTEWQVSFQRTIITLQREMELMWGKVAESQDIPLVICDRGLLDGAAYWPGGRQAFCREFNIDVEWALEQYDAVIHLESLAVKNPDLYLLDRRANNPDRFEDAEKARELDGNVRDAWQGHSNRHFVEGQNDFLAKTAQVIRIVEAML